MGLTALRRLRRKGARCLPGSATLDPMQALRIRGRYPAKKLAFLIPAIKGGGQLVRAE